MEKKEFLIKYPKPEDKILIAKVLDKIQFVKTKNEVQTTDFLDGYQQKLVQKVVETFQVKNAYLEGGYEEAERKMLLLLPEKLENIYQNQKQKMLNQQLSVLSINLPNDLFRKYQHRDYLGAVIKIGMKREKVGDILVRENGADLIVKKEIASYLQNDLSELTRFHKAELVEKTIENLQLVENKKEVICILISQLRLDCIISELLHISRNKATEIINQERAFINYELKTKVASSIKENDILTIRGKGKYHIGKIIGESSKGKIRLEVEKYI